MNTTMTRREFTKAMALGAAAVAAGPALLNAAEPIRKLRIGHTGITWNVFPQNASRPTASDNLDPFIKDCAQEGYAGFECFPQNLADWEAKGPDALNQLIAKYKLPLISCYYTANVVDPAVRKETLDEVIKYAKLVKKYGGTYLVLAPGGGRGRNFDFKAVRQNIIESFNEYGKAVTDIGLGTGLHQHTNTPVDTADEVYAVMENVDTRVFKFAPDVGQLQKAGGDAARIVKDFLSITTHMHLKDFAGWDHYAGYCPLNQGKMDSRPVLKRADVPHDLLKENPGKVDIAAILEMMERAQPQAAIMVELDPRGPLTPLETVQFSRAYLEKLGYRFQPKSQA
jgi:inosose dehydratase